MDSWLIRWRPGDEAAPRIDLPDRGADDRISRADERGVVATVDGYLFDGRGEGSDARRLLACRARHPADFVERLRGGFSALLWEGGPRRLTLVRDALGIRPLFYSWQEGLLLASPSIAAILGQSEVSSRVHRQLAAEMLVFRFNMDQKGETFFEEVQRLPAAHTLVVEEGLARPTRYWDPLPDDFEWATDEELARFTDTFERAVGRCLDAGVDSIALSGGFDSVSAAIVARELGGARPPLHALSLQMTKMPIDEGPTQRAVARALAMPQTLRTVDECLAGRSLVDDALARSGSSPSPVLSIWQSTYTTLLELGSRHGLRRLMLGTGGDETLGVNQHWGADRLRAGDLPGLWRFYRACCRYSPFSSARIANEILWAGTLRLLLLRTLAGTTRRWLPPLHRRLKRERRRRWEAKNPWIHPDRWRDLQQRETEGLSYERGRSDGYYLDTVRQLVQHPLLMLEMDQGSTWAHGMGYQQFFPFWDRDLVELLLRVHPERLIEGGVFKGPLRRLVAERLPGVELPSRKVDFRQGSTNLLRQMGGEAWRALERPLQLERLEIARGDRLEEMVAGFLAGANDRWLATWLALSTESWLAALAGRQRSLSMTSRRALC